MKATNTSNGPCSIMLLITSGTMQAPGSHGGDWLRPWGEVGWGGSRRLKGETLMGVASASPPAEAPSPGLPGLCRSPSWWLGTWEVGSSTEKERPQYGLICSVQELAHPDVLRGGLPV